MALLFYWLLSFFFPLQYLKKSVWICYHLLSIHCFSLMMSSPWFHVMSNSCSFSLELYLVEKYLMPNLSWSLLDVTCISLYQCPWVQGQEEGESYQTGTTVDYILHFWICRPHRDTLQLRFSWVLTPRPPIHPTQLFERKHPRCPLQCDGFIYSLLLEGSVSLFCLGNSQTSSSVQCGHSPSLVLPGQLPPTGFATVLACSSSLERIITWTIIWQTSFLSWTVKSRTESMTISCSPLNLVHLVNLVHPEHSTEPIGVNTLQCGLNGAWLCSGREKLIQSHFWGKWLEAWDDRHLLRYKVS